ncbi:putative origin recognition complex subunit [Rosellinia necatrix]|uniref:Putative origin recognition complex subunit n=1 Tax=Rosellinia necatrix TaxID=77044 RepID=A0A1W2TDY0_ROSNE|nr:putative origin recognition complex subunit [Rosellinia necatrix]
MAALERLDEFYEEKLHNAAYIFDPSGDPDETSRPAKRRRMSKKPDKAGSRRTIRGRACFFQRLLQGAESEQAMRLRQEMFESLWSVIDSRIRGILRDTNQITLQQVTSFVQNAPSHTPEGKIPAAFIITGPNMASQDLLFEQLSDTLRHTASAHVARLRSGDASNLRAVLRKIIHDVVSQESTDEDDLDSTTSKDGRKFLNYDLEALYAHLKLTPRRNLVIIAFQDSEAFDSALLSDLISLLSSWLDRIPLAFLFGVATSVELFEARLLKSTCQNLYGDQFDVEQTTSIIDKIFKAAVAHSEAPLLLGPNLVGSLLERQREQVSSIPDFVRSLKYAYMCHFYANPLSFLVPNRANSDTVQPEHLEMLRCLPSFRQTVQNAIENRNIIQARQLLDDDSKFIDHLADCLRERGRWVIKLLRILKTLTTSKTLAVDFTDLYMDASYHGVSLSGQYGQFFESIRRMEPCDSEGYLSRLLDAMQHGDPSLGMDPWASETPEAVSLLSDIMAGVKQLQSDSASKGHTLRSKYSGQSKVLRTTVVAQKVQLSQDTATLTDYDKSYTDLIDRLLEHLEATMCIDGAYDMPFHEIWLYDSKTPSKDVFIPRPRTVLERALSQPHDYLGCSCCKTSENQIMPTLPTTTILYQLYLETGSLINAADIWSAYYAIVGEDNEDGLDERTALILFYRSMAEMKAMGFVKQSRKKADHVAKLAWKGL